VETNMQELQRVGTTYLSIGHRPALKAYHAHIIHFEGKAGGGDTGWTLEVVGATANGVA
jgi:ABC-type uncharacterized transport system fused permease/ATPase subunit